MNAPRSSSGKIPPHRRRSTVRRVRPGPASSAHVRPARAGDAVEKETGPTGASVGSIAVLSGGALFFCFGLLVFLFPGAVGLTPAGEDAAEGKTAAGAHKQAGKTAVAGNGKEKSDSPAGKTEEGTKTSQPTTGTGTEKYDDFEDPWLTVEEEAARAKKKTAAGNGPSPTPAAPGPTPTPPPKEIPPYKRLAYEGFDHEKKPKDFTGYLETEKTYSGSPGALRAVRAGDVLRARWLYPGTAPGSGEKTLGKPDEEPRFPCMTGAGAVLRFRLYAEDLTGLKILLLDDKGAKFGVVSVPSSLVNAGDWKAVALPLDKAKQANPTGGAGATGPVEAGQTVAKLVWEGHWDRDNKKAEPAFLLDDVGLTVGGTDREAWEDFNRLRRRLVAEARRRKAFLRTVTAEPEKDGYLLNEIIVVALEERFGKTARSRPPLLLRWGEAEVLSPDFLAPLAAAGGPEGLGAGGKQEKWRVSTAMARPWRKPEDVRRACALVLKENPPRLAVFSPPWENVRRGRMHPLELFALLSVWTVEVKKRGVLPVLAVPLIEKAQLSMREQGRLDALRKLMLELGNSQRVPVFDAAAVLEKTNGAFAGRKLTKAGYAALNESFGKLWAALNEYVWKTGKKTGGGIAKPPEDDKFLDE